MAPYRGQLAAWPTKGEGKAHGQRKNRKREGKGKGKWSDKGKSHKGKGDNSDGEEWSAWEANDHDKTSLKRKVEWGDQNSEEELVDAEPGVSGGIKFSKGADGKRHQQEHKGFVGKQELKGFWGKGEGVKGGKATKGPIASSLFWSGPAQKEEENQGETQRGLEPLDILPPVSKAQSPASGKGQDFPVADLAAKGKGKAKGPVANADFWGSLGGFKGKSKGLMQKLEPEEPRENAEEENGALYSGGEEEEGEFEQGEVAGEAAPCPSPAAPPVPFEAGRTSRETLLDAFNNGEDATALLRSAPAECRDDREIVLAAVKLTGCALMYASEGLRADREVVLAAVEQDGFALPCAAPEFRSDLAIVYTAVRQTANALQLASEELRGNRDLVFAAVGLTHHAFKYATDALREDADFVLALARQKGLTIQFVGADLRADREIAGAAVQQDGTAMQFAADYLRSDSTFVLEALGAGQPEAFRFAADHLKHDRSFVLASVSSCGAALQYVSPVLKANRAICMAAITQDGHALQHAHALLRKDWDFVFAAVRVSGTALEFADESLKADRVLVVAAIGEDPAALRFAADQLRQDRDTVLFAAARDGTALRHASEVLRGDREFLVAVAALAPDAEPLSWALPSVLQDESFAAFLDSVSILGRGRLRVATEALAAVHAAESKMRGEGEEAVLVPGATGLPSDACDAEGLQQYLRSMPGAARGAEEEEAAAAEQTVEAPRQDEGQQHPAEQPSTQQPVPRQQFMQPQTNAAPHAAQQLREASRVQVLLRQPQVASQVQALLQTPSWRGQRQHVPDPSRSALRSAKNESGQGWQARRSGYGVSEASPAWQGSPAWKEQSTGYGVAEVDRKTMQEW